MNEQLLSEIKKFITKKNVYFKNFSQALIDFLNESYPEAPNLRSKWYMYVNKMIGIPICKYKGCKSNVKWNNTKNIFDDGCSIEHNRKLTFIKLYGVEHPNKSKKQQKKIKKSIFEKYGVEFITQTDKHKESVKKTNIEKYGVNCVLKLADVREKIKKTNLEKYGEPECGASSVVQEKKRKTNLKKFGFENSLSSPKVREKAHKTNLKKYGSIYPMRNEQLLEKRKQTINDRYDSNGVLGNKEIADKVRKKHYEKFFNSKLKNNLFVSPLFSLDEYIGTKTKVDYRWMCKICNNEFVDNIKNGHMPNCTVCNPKVFRVSKSEIELFESIGVTNKSQSNRDLIEGFEIDIYLPEHKFGIEYNGVFWHSERKGIDKYYHLEKTILSENSGIFLIHIFEYEWILRKQQVLGLINRKIKHFSRVVYVEELEIMEITSEHADLFLEENTLFFQNSFNEKRFGAFLTGELVAVMMIKKFKDCIQISKFYEKNGVGFEGKIVEYMLKKIKITDLPIFYYSDRRFTSINDEMLMLNGFSFEGGTEPDLIYCKNMKSYQSYQITRTNIEQYVDVYDKSLSIYENMLMNNFLTLWDCGKIVWKKK